MRIKPLILTAVSLILLTLPARPSSAVTLLQVDTFEDGTTAGWTVGPQHPEPPANQPTGGPAGAADSYLQILSLGGDGPGSRLAVFNRTQWAGDYLAAGVTAITLQANNLGISDLSIRLLLWDFVPGVGVTNAVITDAEFVPGGSGWMSLAFSLAAPDLTVLAGTAATALSSATELRLFHNPAPDYPVPPTGPPAVTALLGVDNICATTPGVSCPVPIPSPVPAPATALTLAGGVLAWALGRATRRLTRRA